MEKKNIDWDSSLDNSRTDAEVNFKDGDAYFKIKFERQFVVELLSDGQKIQDPTALLQTPHPWNGLWRLFPKTLRYISIF